MKSTQINKQISVLQDSIKIIANIEDGEFGENIIKWKYKSKWS